MLTDNVQLALIASIPPTLAAITALIVSLGNRRKAAETSAAVKENIAKTDTVIIKAAEIHTLTNDNLSKMTSALAVANEKLQGLEKLIANMNKSKEEKEITADKVSATMVLK